MNKLFLFSVFYLFLILFSPNTPGATKTWTNIGGNSLWTSASNWSGNSIPTSSDDVILDNTNISGSYTVIIPVTGSGICRTITIGYPGNLNTITLLFESNSVLGGGGNPAGFAFGDGVAGNLDFSIDQGGVFINASTATNGTNYIIRTGLNDSVRVKNGGKFIQVTPLSFKNPFPALTTTFDPGSTFEENVRGLTSVAPDFNGYTFSNLIIAADSAGGVRTYAAAGGGGNFNVLNTWTIKPGVTMSPSNLSGNVNDLIFNGSMGFTNNANSPLTILGNVTINAAFSTSNAMTVNFNGSSTQTISGTTQITFSGNVTLNNSSGLILSNNTTVNGILTLTSGNITNSNSSLLIIGSNGSISGSISGYVNGPLVRTIASILPKTLSYPIGKAGSFRPVSLNVTQNAATATTYMAEMFNSPPPSRTLPSSLDRVSFVRYFNITKSAGANVTTAQVTLNYDNAAFDDGVRDSPNLRVAKDDGAGHWLDIGGDPASTNFTGNITPSISVTTFGDFVLANNTGGVNILGSVPAAPLLVSPLSNSTGLQITPTLVWRKVSTASSYRLQVATDSLFSSIIINDSTITDTVRLLSPLQNGTKYYWRVKANNIAGTSGYSSAFNFTTVLSAPQLLSPVNGELQGFTWQHFTWSAVNGTLTYHFQLAKDSLFALVVADDTILTVTTTEAHPLTVNTKYFWRVQAKNQFSISSYSPIFNFVSAITGINDNLNAIPTAYYLYQNYPNPFNPTTVIKFDLPEAGIVTMKIYDILGKEVRTLVNDFRNAGRYNVTFDASNLPSGIYICSVKSNNFSSVKKLMLLK